MHESIKIIGEIFFKKIPLYQTLSLFFTILLKKFKIFFKYLKNLNKTWKILSKKKSILK